MNTYPDVNVNKSTAVSDSVLISLRRIIQAIDLHSRQLVRQHGITTPQLIVLKQIQGNSAITVSQVAKQVSLKQATVTDILNRLERKGLVQRQKDTSDRRRVLVKETDAGKKMLDAAPSPLQDTFLEKFENLDDWQQNMILSSLQLLGTLMTDDEDSGAPISAAPILSTGMLTESIDDLPLKNNS
ncbi:MarR family winged helix-turn-helix transcriptional regulator [Desulfosediminicola flagellatus]|uniref:MarR family winged helix-turn-helix transcriptional regulator n=1 Tax=Desulfosediminicola flagellatus TaxID=2569541 RepID=UPI0010AC1BC7|nr:MarR family transcriptional regulator [Desulfosediminicola flagellatus]